VSLLVHDWAERGNVHVRHRRAASAAFTVCVVVTQVASHPCRITLEITHTHPFNGPLSETTQVSRYQKGKANLDFTEARDSEWPWHQQGRMQVCTSLQTDNHASTPPLSFLQAGCPSCRPTDSVKALKAARLKSPHYDTIPSEVDHVTDVRMYLNLVHVHTTTYTVRQKKGTNFLLSASLLTLDRNWCFKYLYQGTYQLQFRPFNFGTR